LNSIFIFTRVSMQRKLANLLSRFISLMSSMSSHVANLGVRVTIRKWSHFVCLELNAFYLWLFPLLNLGIEVAKFLLLNLFLLSIHLLEFSELLLIVSNFFLCKVNFVLIISLFTFSCYVFFILCHFNVKLVRLLL